MSRTVKKLELAEHMAYILEILDVLENDEVNELLVITNPNEDGEGDYEFKLGSHQTTIAKIGLKKQLQARLDQLERKYSTEKMTVDVPPLPTTNKEVSNAVHKE